jgi:hypothetical protein
MYILDFHIVSSAHYQYFDKYYWSIIWFGSVVHSASNYVAFTTNCMFNYIFLCHQSTFCLLLRQRDIQIQLWLYKTAGYRNPVVVVETRGISKSSCGCGNQRDIPTYSSIIWFGSVVHSASNYVAFTTNCMFNYIFLCHQSVTLSLRSRTLYCKGHRIQFRTSSYPNLQPHPAVLYKPEGYPNIQPNPAVVT